MKNAPKPQTQSRRASLNLAPLFLRDIEDLARLAKENAGTHAENLFTRAAVIALDHFVNLYLERISSADRKDQAKNEIDQQRSFVFMSRRNGMMVEFGGEAP
jgi:hypothetical protein